MVELLTRSINQGHNPSWCHRPRAPPHLMSWVGGRCRHRKVQTHPLGTPVVILRIRNEYRPGGPIRAGRASILCQTEIALARACCCMPVIKYLLGTSASSPLGDGCGIELAGGSCRAHQATGVAPSDGRGVRAAGVYSPPMLVKDTELCGEYDGVDAQEDMGEGAINPIVRPGGFPYPGGSARARRGA